MAAPHSVRQATVQAQPWLEKLARLGYAAKGVIYSLIGVLALVAAFGPGGKTTNQAGAINTIANQPLGKVLLVAIGVGLFGYALWRILQAAYNPEHKKPIKRIGYVVSALAYGGFGWAALAASAGDRAEGQSKENAATLLNLPFGQMLMMILAAIFLAVAVGQIVNGIKLNFERILKMDEMSSGQRSLAKWTGRLGLIARGILFSLVAWFMWRAATNDNPQAVGGIERALQTVAQAPSGRILLPLLALGLICYGIFMFIEARFRRMVPATQ